MKARTPQRRFSAGLVWLAWMLCLVATTAPAANTVHENDAEFHVSGDFNGDGLTDVAVVEKANGTVRVGFQNGAGGLTWSPALPTGAEPASAVAVGRFSSSNRVSLAVTAPELNRVRIVSPLTVSNAPVVTIQPPHPGTALLAGLDAPMGPEEPLSWIAAGTHDPGVTLVDLLAFAADGLAAFQDQIADESFLDSASSMRRSATDLTLLTLFRRGATNDMFLAYALTNTAQPVLVRSNLPAGAEYVSGHFNGEPYPRLLFYVPGQSNVIVQPLLHNGSEFEFGTATVNTFTSAVQRVYYIDEGTNGLALIRFGNGVSGRRLPTQSGVLQAAYEFGSGSAGNLISGVAPLGSGSFALLLQSSNSPLSTEARLFAKSGANYNQMSGGTLTSATSGTRGNVWLFQSEPFLNSSALLVGSLSAPSWSSEIMGMPGTLSVRVESDGGVTSGLGNPATNSFGAPPAGAVYVLPNQYRADISFFGTAPPRAPEPSVVTISPPPGSYQGPLQISLSSANPFDDLFYRIVNQTAWQSYSTPFALTEDGSVEYYGQSLSGVRGRVRLAAYDLGQTNPPVEPLIELPENAGNTNNPPLLSTNFLQIAASGTVFYSRRPAAGNGGSIWAINLDGSGETFITAGHRPRVTPDGTRMAFLRTDPSGTDQIWLRDLQTGLETPFFTNATLDVVGFDWRDSGSELVFDHACNLWRQLIGGSPESVPFPAGCLSGVPVVNPQTGALAYHQLDPNGPPGIYVTPPNWSAPARLNLPPSGWVWPAWSPDGTRLLIADSDPLSATENGGANLWTARADGSDLRQITALVRPDGFPRGAIWKPDASCLAGAGTIHGTNGLWIIPLALDGGSCHCPPRLLPTSPGDPIDFAGSIVVRPAAQAVANSGLFIRLDPSMAVVYWSTDYAGYTLEYTPSLVEPDWVPITGPYFLNGSYYEYREPRATLLETRYFRLRYPGVLILTPPEPPLSMRVEGTTAVLTWPLAYVGYTLERSLSLSPASWTPVPPPYPITNGVFEIQRVLMRTNAAEYFRLRW